MKGTDVFLNKRDTFGFIKLNSSNNLITGRRIDYSIRFTYAPVS